MTKPLWRMQTLLREAHTMLFDYHDEHSMVCGCRAEPPRECDTAMLMHNIDAVLKRKIKPTYRGDEV